MDKLLEITLLYDFYGDLLTDKQKSVVELYYLNDNSLHEIADEYGITRQAVMDMLRRAEKLLRQYEEKLGLVGRYTMQKKRLSDMTEKLNELIEKSGLETKEIKELVGSLPEILD